MHFWKDGISISETKVSALILGFLSLLVFVMVYYWKNHDISIYFIEIIKVLIFCIASVNGIDILTKSYGDSKKGGDC